MFNKIINRDFRGFFLTLGAIGGFLLLGSAGMSDNGASLTEFIPYILIGLLLIAISFAYIYFYEFILND